VEEEVKEKQMQMVRQPFRRISGKEKKKKKKKKKENRIPVPGCQKSPSRSHHWMPLQQQKGYFDRFFLRRPPLG
jgi:hypothetical protein